MIKKILVASVAFWISQQAFSFGKNGHRIVAHIAEQNLTQAAKINLKKLTKGVPLAKLSTWADEIRSEEKWKDSSPWHYVSVADDVALKNVKHTHKGDILEKLQQVEKQLMNGNDIQQRWQALAFYIHLVGDVHQPLHVGRKEDRGGNKIKLSWFGDYTNLHKVWDTDLIEFQGLSYVEYADFIDEIDSSLIKQWQSSDYLDWAEESKAMRGNVYDLPESGKLHFEFTHKYTPIINQRLAQAGFRLAAKINQFFDEK